MQAVCHRPWSLLALAVALVACTRNEPAPEPIRAVRTLTLRTESTGGSVEFAAEVKARVESRLSFRVAGRMISRSAEVGQHVRPGQALAELDAADLKLSQEAALAATRAAQTNYELAAAEFKRYQELRSQGFISALDLERRESSLKAQKAQLDQAGAQAGVQVNQAGYATLSAMAPGIVTEVDAEAGSVLAAGSTVLRLAHDGPRDVVFAVPEDGVAGLRALQGRPGAIRIRAWGSAAELPATVREVAAAADPATRTFQIKADVGSAALQLGQTVTARVERPRIDATIRLPLAAVTQLQGQSSVWLLDRTTMTVKAQPIVVAGADGNVVVVAAGLSAGQTVVTAGVHALSPGQKVKLYEASAVAATAAASR
jgi:RND family efflux transporter MFP subunit